MNLGHQNQHNRLHYSPSLAEKGQTCPKSFLTIPSSVLIPINLSTKETLNHGFELENGLDKSTITNWIWWCRKCEYYYFPEPMACTACTVHSSGAGPVFFSDLRTCKSKAYIKVSANLPQTYEKMTSMRHRTDLK